MAEDCIVIAEVEGSNPIPPWIFSGFLFKTAIVALIYNRNDFLSLGSSSRSSYTSIWFAHIHYSVSKVIVKRATETCYFSAASYLAHFTTHIQSRLATNQVVASFENTDFWLVKITRESPHTRDLCHLLQNKALGDSEQGWIQDFFKEGVVILRIQGKCPRAKGMQEGGGWGRLGLVLCLNM